MKTLGLIGGIGWESTARYYTFLNEDVRNRLGSLHTARLILNSIEFNELDTLIKTGHWNMAGAMLADAARGLERAGAECVILCSNLAHFVTGHIEETVTIPVLHIGDAIIEGVRESKSAAHIGLLGTRFTLEHGFILGRARSHPRWGLPTAYTPDSSDQKLLDEIIYEQLCRGLVREDSRIELRRMIRGLQRAGAQSVVLASSELATLLEPKDFAAARIFDSTELHARYAVRWAFGETKPRADFSRPTLTVVPGAYAVKRSKLALVGPRKTA